MGSGRGSFQAGQVAIDDGYQLLLSVFERKSSCFSGPLDALVLVTGPHCTLNENTEPLNQEP